MSELYFLPDTAPVLCQQCGLPDSFGRGYCYNCDTLSDIDIRAIQWAREARWRRLYDRRCWLAVGLLFVATAILTAAVI